MSEFELTSIGRVRMPVDVIDSVALQYLMTEGLPSKLQWDYPIYANKFDHYVVDFSFLINPVFMVDLLSSQATPRWFVECEQWERFVVIGTFEQAWSDNSFRMTWKICVDIESGRVFRVETNPDYLRLSLSSNQTMSECDEVGDSPIDVLQISHSECVVFINSSCIQMMRCFELYFQFVRDKSAAAEEFLRAISRIDPPASEVGSLWYWLVGELLHPHEY